MLVTAEVITNQVTAKVIVIAKVKIATGPLAASPSKNTGTPLLQVLTGSTECAKRQSANPNEEAKE